MSFTDYPYYISVVILLLFIVFVKKEHRWALLLLFSVIFYGYGRWEYLLLLLFSIAIDYFCALSIASSNALFKRRVFLFISIATNLSILFFFKYFTEIYDSWSWVEMRTSVLNMRLEHILLPLGISFYTLQSMGYTIDVYRKTIQPERHFGYFSLYVCFFPQLVAGPIERAHQLLPQLRNSKPINIERIQSGLFLIGFGLFKKFIVADRLFLILNENLSSTNDLLGWQAASFGTIAFFAVYMDISAYTDIARGSARLFGIELSLNFKRPMLAHSIGEFWQRWHISLSSWMMNYLFKPLAQLSESKIHRNLAIIITFLVIGIWHGPTWPFVLMGLLHGAVIVFERIAVAIKLKWPKSTIFNAVRLLRTHIIINISGVLFLSPTMEVANNIYHNIFYFESFFGEWNYDEKVYGPFFFELLIGGFAVVILVSLLKELPIIKQKKLSVWNKYLILYILIFIVMAFSAKAPDDFLYFDF